jgi:purine-nucleoside phosphorylase
MTADLDVSPSFELQPAVRRAADHIAARIGAPPEVAIILGSGLGGLADAVRDARSFIASDIPGYPSATVPGHEGRLVFGELGPRRVVVVQGRFHLYEGFPIDKVVFPVNLVRALGASCLFVTNASGGIRPGLTPGTLMWITDHINLTGEAAPPAITSGRLTKMRLSSSSLHASVPYYDVLWTRNASERATALGIPTRQGTYLWTRGPSYETRAEIRAFRTLGADVVGMSTVPEVVAAHLGGMKVIGISTVTNFATGLGSGTLDHSEVIEIGRSVRADLERLSLAVLETAPM